MEEVLAAPTAREVTERLLMGIAEKQTDPANPPGCLLVQGGIACGSGSENVPFELAARRAQNEDATPRPLHPRQGGRRSEARPPIPPRSHVMYLRSPSAWA